MGGRESYLWVSVGEADLENERDKAEWLVV